MMLEDSSKSVQSGLCGVVSDTRFESNLYR